MAIKLFTEIKDESLLEYADNSNYEMYKGIVLDSEDNKFKVVSGMFRDKKEFYEKMAKQGLVCRKVFEKKVYEWIEDNARNNLEAYLMFSTAFSKWKGNNMLADHYVKLLNDIPQLNREGQKGNPNSRGGEGGQFGEAVLRSLRALEEDAPMYYTNPDVEREDYDRRKIVELTPLDKNGNRTTDPIRLEVNLFDFPSTDIWDEKLEQFDADGKPSKEFQKRLNKRYDDPEFYREIFKMKTKDVDQAFSMADSFNIKEADKFGPGINVSKGWLYSQYPTKNKRAAYEWGPKEASPQTSMDRKIVAARGALTDIAEVPEAQRTPEQKAMFDQMTKELLHLQTASRMAQADVGMGKRGLKKAERERYNDLRAQHHEITNATMPDEISRGSKTDRSMWNIARQNEIVRIRDEMNAITDNARERGMQKRALRTNSLSATAGDLQYQADKRALADDEFLNSVENNGISFPNPRHNGTASDMHMDKYEKLKKTRANVDRRQDNQAYINAKRQADAENLNNWDNMDYTKRKQMQGAWETSKKEAAPAVNDGVTSMYRNQQPSGRPMDVFPTNRGVLPVCGLFMEDDEKAEPAGVTTRIMDGALNQKLFDETRLRADVREALLDIARVFEESLDLGIEPVDIYFTGSNVTLNYTTLSDIDLHLVYDFENVGLNAELLANYLKTAKKLFNSTYDLTVKSSPVEVGCENIHEPLHASSIYSLMQDKWIKGPELKLSQPAKPDEELFHTIVDKIEVAIQSHDADHIRKLWKDIGTMRKAALDTDGELGAGNALFKKLRNLGYIDRLKEAYYASASDRLSLESLEEL